jgi:hypothetical protein
LKSEVKFYAAAGWVRDKILKKPRQNQKLNITFHTERADINSASISNLIKEYERYENGDIFSHDLYDEVTHIKASKLKKLDISTFNLKSQNIQMEQIKHNSSE